VGVVVVESWDVADVVGVVGVVAVGAVVVGEVAVVVVVGIVVVVVGVVVAAVVVADAVAVVVVAVVAVAVVVVVVVVAVVVGVPVVAVFGVAVVGVVGVVVVIEVLSSDLGYCSSIIQNQPQRKSKLTVEPQYTISYLALSTSSHHLHQPPSTAINSQRLRVLLPYAHDQQSTFTTNVGHALDTTSSILYTNDTPHLPKRWRNNEQRSSSSNVGFAWGCCCLEWQWFLTENTASWFGRVAVCSTQDNPRRQLVIVDLCLCNLCIEVRLEIDECKSSTFPAA
jgi:hypothetical protein